MAGFTVDDWAVLLGYFALLAGTGYAFSLRRQRDADDYFLAARSMPGWAVAFSVLATSQSAATFIGAPESAYAGDLTYMSANIGQFTAALIVAFIFIPAFYRQRVTTVYELLETRFGTPSKLAASWMFMVGRLFASGARLFMGSLAMSMVLFGEVDARTVALAIGVTTFIGIAYTFVGGIRSIIYTDVIQTVVYVGAAVAAMIVLLRLIPADTTQLLDAMRDADKLTWLRTGFEDDWPRQTFTLWTALLGFTLLNLGFYGTDQDGMQRMLTCRSGAHASRSMIGAMLLGVPVTLLFMVVGLLLWALYTQPGLAGDALGAPPDRKLEIFLHFIMTRMPPGVRGLMMAGLIAAALSSLNSALNAMSSAFVNDVFRPMRRDLSPAAQVWVGRAGVLVFGVLLGGFAMFCYFWQQRGAIPLINFALLVMVFAYSGLVGVFLVVLLTRRGNNISAIAGLLTGFIVTLVHQPYVFQSLTPEAWHVYALAFPWQMVVATGAAFLVCFAGSPRPSADTMSS